MSILSCQNSKSDKVDLICENGNKRISVEIENGRNFLTYDEPVKTDFIVTNIDLRNLRVYGAGIKVLGTKKEKTGMRTEIKVPSNYLKSDTLTVKVWFDNTDNSKFCEFKIPVREPK